MVRFEIDDENRILIKEPFQLIIIFDQFLLQLIDFDPFLIDFDPFLIKM